MGSLQFDSRVSEAQAQLVVDVVGQHMVEMEADASHEGRLVGQFSVRRLCAQYSVLPQCHIVADEAEDFYSIEVLQQLRAVPKGIYARRHHVLEAHRSTGYITVSVEDNVHSNNGKPLRSDGFEFDWSTMRLSKKQKAVFADRYETYLRVRRAEESLLPLPERSVRVMWSFLNDVSTGYLELEKQKS